MKQCTEVGNFFSLLLQKVFLGEGERNNFLLRFGGEGGELGKRSTVGGVNEAARTRRSSRAAAKTVVEGKVRPKRGGKLVLGEPHPKAAEGGKRRKGPSPEKRTLKKSPRQIFRSLSEKRKGARGLGEGG